MKRFICLDLLSGGIGTDALYKKTITKESGVIEAGRSLVLQQESSTSEGTADYNFWATETVRKLLNQTFNIDLTLRTIAEFAEDLSVTIEENLDVSNSFEWNLSSFKSIKSAAFWTVISDEGIHLLAPRRGDDSQRRAFQKDIHFVSRLRDLNNDINIDGETAEDFTVLLDPNDTVTPYEIDTELKNFIIAKRKSLCDVIVFRSHEDADLLDWIKDGSREYVILSKMEVSSGGWEYIAVLESSSNKTFTGGSIYPVLRSSGSGGVSSFNGRTGVVVPADGDYDADQVNFTPYGGLSATDAQGAIQELEDEKQDALGYTPQNSANKASSAEVDAGTDNSKHITPYGLAGSEYVKSSDLPGKASASDIIEGSEDTEYVTPKGLCDAKVGQLENELEKQGVVFSATEAWENGVVAEQNIMYESGIYKMWYRANFGVNAKHGYATSPDLVNWTPDAGNPMTLPMPSGKTCAYYDYLIKVGGTYYLFASVYPGDNLYRWSSADGINWSLDNGGDPVLETGSGWEANAICNVAVIYDDGEPTYKWKMLYEALGSVFQIGYAYSADGLSWTKYSGNPVLPAISGTWRHSATGNPELFKHNGVYYAIYGGVSSAGLWTIGVSRSFDMINWDDYDFNPLIYSTEAYEGDHCTDVGVVKNADGSLHDAVGLRYSTYLHYGADQKDIALATFKRLRLAEFLKLTEPPLLSSMINPMTTDGDIIYGGLSGIPSRLAANNTGTRKYLSQISGGTPSWETVSGGGGVSYYKQVFTADGTWSHPNPGNAIPIVVTLLGPGGDGGAGGNGGNGSTGYIGGGGGGGGGGEDGQMIVYSATQEQDLVITINTGTKTEVTGSGFSTKTASKASNGANGAAGTNATAANGVPGLSGKGFLPGAAAAETATSGTGRDGGSASHAKFGAGGAAGASNQNGSAGSAGENGGTYGAGGAGGGGGGGGNGNGKTGGSGGAGGIGASGFVIVEWWA